MGTTIHLFQSDAELANVLVHPMPRHHQAFQGESSRIIPNLLREAGWPMCEAMRHRMSASFRGLWERGKVQPERKAGERVRW